MYKRTE